MFGLGNVARRIYGHFIEYDGHHWLWPLKVLSRVPKLPYAGLGHLCTSPLYKSLLKIDDEAWHCLEKEQIAFWHSMTHGIPQDDFSQVLVMDATMIAISQFAAKSGQWDLAPGTYYPFLAPNMTSLARCLPQSMLLNGATSKPLLKDLVGDLGLPKHFAYRPKSGFQPPLQRLLTQHRASVLALLERDCELSAHLTAFARELPQRLLKRSDGLTSQTLFTLWGLLVLKIWLAHLRQGTLSFPKGNAFANYEKLQEG